MIILTHAQWTASVDKTGRRTRARSNSLQCLPRCQPTPLCVKSYKLASNFRKQTSTSTHISC